MSWMIFCLLVRVKECQYLLDSFLEICKDLGVLIVQEKTFGPVSTLSFLGIELDCKAQEARLPEDKLKKCEHMLESFLGKKKISLKDMLSMIGFLSFCCNVVVPGRAFCRRLIDKTRGVKKLHHRIKLNKECKLDMQTWLHFIKKFNGKSFFLDNHWNDSDTLKLYTDASKMLGFGGIFGSKWFFGEWPDKWKAYNIVILELFPIVLAIEVWGSQLQNKQIYINTDNEALVHILNKQSFSDKLTMILIRCLVLLLLRKV